MDSASDSIKSIAKSTAEINFIALTQAVAAGEDPNVVGAKNEKDVLATASCFQEGEIELFKETYYSEFRRLSAEAVKKVLSDPGQVSLGQAPERTIDRASIRDYVVRECEEKKLCVRNGGNVFQLTLDLNDALDARIKDFSEAEKIAFLNIYTQELEAVNSQDRAELSAIQAKAQSDQADQNTFEKESQAAWGKVFGFIILIGFVMFVIYKR